LDPYAIWPSVNRRVSAEGATVRISGESCTRTSTERRRHGEAGPGPDSVSDSSNMWSTVSQTRPLATRLAVTIAGRPASVSRRRSW